MFKSNKTYRKNRNVSDIKADKEQKSGNWVAEAGEEDDDDDDDDFFDETESEEEDDDEGIDDDDDEDDDEDDDDDDDDDEAENFDDKIVTLPTAAVTSNISTPDDLSSLQESLTFISKCCWCYSFSWFNKTTKFKITGKRCRRTIRKCKKSSNI